MPPSRAAVLSAALWICLSACGGSLGAATQDSLPGTLVVPMVPSGQPEQPQLFRMNPDGTGLVQLTSGTGMGAPTDANDFPVLARDRKTLLFASGRDFPAGAASGNPNPMLRMAYLMDPAGGKARRLTHLDPKHDLEYPNDLAPDGTWAVLAVVNDGTRVPETLRGFSKLYRAKLDGSSCAMLIPDDPLSRGAFNLDGAVFTGDGQTLVFVADGPGNATEIWKLDLATLNTTQVTHEGDRGGRVSWRRPMIAPGNDRIYFSTMQQDATSGSLQVIHLDGTGEAEVLAIPRDPVSLAFSLDCFALSPDGNALACARGTGPSNKNVITMGMDGQDAKILGPAATFIGWGNIAWR